MAWFGQGEAAPVKNRSGILAIEIHAISNDASNIEHQVARYVRPKEEPDKETNESR